MKILLTPATPFVKLSHVNRRCKRCPQITQVIMMIQLALFLADCRYFLIIGGNSGILCIGENASVNLSRELTCHSREIDHWCSRLKGDGGGTVLDAQLHVILREGHPESSVGRTSHHNLTLSWACSCVLCLATCSNYWGLLVNSKHFQRYS